MIPSFPYLLIDLTNCLLEEYSDGIAFPPSVSLEPVFIQANITKQIYRKKYVLSLELRLEPKKVGLEGTGDKWWRNIVEVVRDGILGVDREEGMGRAPVLEGGVEEVQVRAEWRVWEVVDGEARVCGY